MKKATVIMRLSVLMLALAVAAALFAGCGPNGGKETVKNPIDVIAGDYMMMTPDSSIELTLGVSADGKKITSLYAGMQNLEIEVEKLDSGDYVMLAGEDADGAFYFWDPVVIDLINDPDFDVKSNETVKRIRTIAEKNNWFGQETYNGEQFIGLMYLKDGLYSFAWIEAGSDISVYSVGYYLSKARTLTAVTKDTLTGEWTGGGHLVMNGDKTFEFYDPEESVTYKGTYETDESDTGMYKDAVFLHCSGEEKLNGYFTLKDNVLYLYEYDAEGSHYAGLSLVRK